jgi:regulation of enolase protein 1 (concanavalin A-like superfamily)
MTSTHLYEPFDNPTFDPRLAWFNPPHSWKAAHSWLQVDPGAKTDFWQQPHHDIRSDNGPFLFAEVTGNFILTTHVRMHPANQYDQAGLMVRLSPACWLKTSLEFEVGIPSKLGSVITHDGFSDWATQDYSGARLDLDFRVRREGSDYTVDCSQDGSNWSQIRFSHLARSGADDGKRPVMCGLYACSPIASGFLAEFDFLKIEAF